MYCSSNLGAIYAKGLLFSLTVHTLTKIVNSLEMTVPERDEKEL